MLVRNDIDVMPIQQEEEHIVELLNHYIDKIGCKTLLYYNYGHVEDMVFYYFFKANADKINANLLYCGIKVEDNPNEQIEFIDNNDFALSALTLLLTKAIAIVNPQTQFAARSIGAPLHYTIKVFDDYSWEYMDKLAAYYQIPPETIVPYGVSEKFKDMLKEYLYGNKLTEIYTSEEIRAFIKNLEKQQINNAIIYNSVTYNFMKEIQDL